MRKPKKEKTKVHQEEAADLLRRFEASRPTWMVGEPRGGRLGALEALAMELLRIALAYAAWRQPPARRPWVAAHHAARWDPETALLMEAARALARALVYHLDSPAERKLAQACDALAAQLDLPVTGDQLLPFADDADEARQWLLQEFGVEDHSLYVECGWGPSGNLVGAVIGIDKRFANNHLMTHAVEAALAWAERDELFRQELRACRWLYDGWGGPGGGAPYHNRRGQSHRLRELEFLLVDRPALAFGSPPLDAFLAQVPAGAISERQRTLLASLRDSASALWIVKRRKGDRVTVEDTNSGMQVDFTEHHPRADYGPHDYIIGRIIAGSSTRAGFRSMGSVTWKPRDAAAARGLADHTAKAYAWSGMPPLCVEGAIRFISDPKAIIPDCAPPAASPEDAMNVRRQFLEMLQDRGLTKAAGVVEGGRVTGKVAQWFEGEAVIGNWLTALEEQRDGTRWS
jgi:hypothetical protein